MNHVFQKAKDNPSIIAIIGFGILALLMIVLSICVLKEPVVAVCVLIIIETAIAVMLHHAELWIHGVFVLAEIIAGILMGRAVLVIFCAVVYIAATIALKFIITGEDS